MDKEKEPTSNELLKSYIELYLADNAYSQQDELEIKFGTKPYNQITKIDFDNIILIQAICMLPSQSFTAAPLHIHEGVCWCNRHKFKLSTTQ